LQQPYLRMPVPATFRLTSLRLLPDAIMVILYGFCLNPMMEWQAVHLSLSCTLLMLLNIVAVSLGCFNFFSMYNDAAAMTDYKNSLNKFQSAALGLSVFISCLAFLWWLVPFAGARAMGVAETYAGIGMVVYFICFIGVVAGSINNKKAIAVSGLLWLKIITNIVTVIFFFFSYAFLILTLQHWQPGWIAAPYLAVICLFVFYLPLRFFLLLKPPFYQLEYVSFILSFGFLMVRLFGGV